MYEFAGHTLDVRHGRLLKEGRDVPLRAKSLALLTFLVQNPGRVIGKEELVEAVWPDVAVTDDSLTQCVMDIRRTLGADASDFIRNVPRRGYIVDEARIVRAQETSARGAARPDKRPSIAVMPFTVMSGIEDQRWIADGVAEDIIIALSRNPRLFVVSRNVSFAHRTNGDQLAETASALGVEHVLLGSVRVQSGVLRLTAQLVEPTTGGVLWAERFDRKMDDVFAVQDEITVAVVERLNIELANNNVPALDRPGSLEAYECYLRGRRLCEEWVPSGVTRARNMFRRAVQLEPSYARALAGVATCDSFLHEWNTASSPDETIRTADRALSIDSSLGEALAARGFARFRVGQTEQARHDFEHAFRVEQDCYEAHFFFAFMSRSLGDYRAAIKHYIRASQLRLTDHVSANAIIGLLDRDDPALQEWARICVTRAEAAAASNPEDSAPLCRGALGLVYLGEEKKALRQIEQAMALDPDDPIVIYNAASLYALLHRTEEALDLLERYFEMSERAAALGTIAHDREFETLRHEPRYRALIG